MSPRGRSLTTCLKPFFYYCSMRCQCNAGVCWCWSVGLYVKMAWLGPGTKDHGPGTRTRDQGPRIKDQGSGTRTRIQGPLTEFGDLGPFKCGRGAEKGLCFQGVWKGARWFRGMGTGVWVGAKVCKAMDLSFPRPFFTQGPRICWRWRSHPF